MLILYDVSLVARLPPVPADTRQDRLMAIMETLMTFVVGGGAVGIGAWYLKYKDQKSKQEGDAADREEVKRKDVVGQLQGYCAMLQARIEQVEDDGRAREARHDTEFRDLHSAHVKCQVENEGLRQRIDFLQGTIDNLRAGMDPLFSSILSPMANVVADEDGMVVSASPFIFSMFHWSEREIVGQNVKRLIPIRFHAAHEAGLARVKASGMQPDGKIFRLTGITKQGEEFPISLKLEAWRDRARWFFSAYIQKRSNDDGGGSGSNAEMAVFKTAAAGGAVPVVIVNSPTQPVPNRPVDRPETPATAPVVIVNSPTQPAPTEPHP